MKVAHEAQSFLPSPGPGPGQGIPTLSPPQRPQRREHSRSAEGQLPHLSSSRPGAPLVRLSLVSLQQCGNPSLATLVFTRSQFPSVRKSRVLHSTFTSPFVEGKGLKFLFFIQQLMSLHLLSPSPEHRAQRNHRGNAVQYAITPAKSHCLV